MATIDSFHPLTGKLTIQSTPYVLYQLVKWVFRNYLIYGHVCQISALWWPEHGSNSDGFLSLSGILITQSTACLVNALSLQKWYDIWSRWYIFGPLVAENGRNWWLSIIIWNIDHWMSRDWCINRLREFSEIIHFFSHVDQISDLWWSQNIHN